MHHRLFLFAPTPVPPVCCPPTPAPRFAPLLLLYLWVISHIPIPVFAGHSMLHITHMLVQQTPQHDDGPPHSDAPSASQKGWGGGPALLFAGASSQMKSKQRRPLVGRGWQSKPAALRLFMPQGCHRFISLSLCIVKRRKKKKEKANACPFLKSQSQRIADSSTKSP